MQDYRKKTGKGKVVIIGTGICGNEIAWLLTSTGCFDELVLVDRNAIKAEAEAQELRDLTQYFGEEPYIHAGTYADCGDADVIALTCGAPPSGGLSREQNYEETLRRYEKSMMAVMETGFDGVVFLMAYMEEGACQYVCDLTGLPDSKVFAVGLNLFSERLRSLIAEKESVRPSAVETYVVGANKAHMAFPSNTKINGKTLYDMETLQEMVETAYLRGHELILALGPTAYHGICSAFVRVIKAILKDEQSIHVLCVKLHGEYGILNKWVSVPCRVGRGGISEIFELKVTEEERKMLKAAAYRETIVEYEFPFSS